MRPLRRLTPLIALLVAAVLLAACSSDSGSKKAKPKSTKSTTSATTPAAAGATTTAADPASCIRGNFRFTRMDYDGPVQSQFGPTMITGGSGGRRIELKRGDTFHFTDDGSDKVQFSLLGNPPTNGTAVLKAQSDGGYVPTAQKANFNITALSGTLVLTLQNG